MAVKKDQNLNVPQVFTRVRELHVCICYVLSPDTPMNHRHCQDLESAAERINGRADSHLRVCYHPGVVTMVIKIETPGSIDQGSGTKTERNM